MGHFFKNLDALQTFLCLRHNHEVLVYARKAFCQSAAPTEPPALFIM